MNLEKGELGGGGELGRHAALLKPLQPAESQTWTAVSLSSAAGSDRTHPHRAAGWNVFFFLFCPVSFFFFPLFLGSSLLSLLSGVEIEHLLQLRCPETKAPENPWPASRADIIVQRHRDQYFIKMLLGNHYSLLKFMSLLQPADLCGDDKRPTFGPAGLTLLIKCHRSCSFVALPMAGLCDASAFHVFIYFFWKVAKKKKKSPASWTNEPGGIFDFTVHYARGTARPFQMDVSSTRSNGFEF